MAKLIWTRSNAFLSERSNLPTEVQPICDNCLAERMFSSLPGEFPLLLSKTNRPIEPALAYLYDVAVVNGKSRSPRTLKTYAESLFDWFQYLETNNCDWDEIGEEDVAVYRNEMLGTEKKTRRVLSRTTVNMRVKTVWRFYRWLSQNLYIDEFPFSDEARLTLREYRRFPRLLSREDLSAIFERCAAPYSLMIKWMVCTGLRRFEVSGLTIEQIASSASLDPRIDHFPEIEVQRKGGSTQRIMVPLGLIDETNWYISTTREQILAKTPRANRSAVANGPIFLTTRGSPVSPDRLGRVFAAAAKTAGISASSHHLRHTYAICMLLLLEREAGKGIPINPLKTLQVLLNHKSISSTEIYLQALDVYSAEVKKSLKFLYGGKP